MKALMKKHLKQKAHSLNPVVIIGGSGLTEGVHREIDVALDAHELIKVRVNAEDRDQRKQMIDTICQHHQADLIQAIGHIIAIYRESPEK